jgi:hypothetical protein
MSKYLLAVLLLFSIIPVKASLIDVTTLSQVTLQTNDSLIFTLSTDYASCHQSGYPAEIEILLGSMPLGGPVDAIPGTSSVYVPGILFAATLESQDGAVSIPLTDSDATRLGLPTGDVLLTPGSVSGGSYSGPIDLISAGVTISSPQAAELFGESDLTIDIRNMGGPITFGYPSSIIAADFTATLVTAGGSQSEGARVLEAQCRSANAPEPGTIGLLLIGLTVMARRSRGRRRP